MSTAIYSVEDLKPEHYKDMFIYQVTNKVNGKRYIGKTSKNVEQRWYHHCKAAEYGCSTYLYSAIRKYSADNFVVELLEATDEDLNERECFWISKLKPEYNMTSGGDGGWINDQTGNTWQVKDPSKMGKVFKAGQQTRYIDYSKMSSGNNYQSLYYIHTPWGIFETWKDACDIAKALRKQGRKDVVTDKSTLRKYCTENIQLSAEGRRTFADWRGKFTTDLGFYTENKSGSC